MYNAEFFGTFDVASLALTLFTGFFFALVIYLRREDRREGYPLEDDSTGRHEPLSGFFFTAKPKTFLLAHGAGEVVKPDGLRDPAELKAGRRSNLSGTPLQPIGDPMLAGVGPGAWADRSDRVDLMAHGLPKLTPLRGATEFYLDSRDPDPRGRTVLGADRRPAGLVADVWIDRAEILVRYLEVELTAAAPSGLTVVGETPAVGGGRRVLLPMTMAVISRSKPVVYVEAITAAQFADVPQIASLEQITFYEEERIVAYYGAGYLYAMPQRLEPLL